MKELAKKKRVITFGIKNKSDFCASHIKIEDTHLEFVLNDRYKVRLNTIFYKNIYNTLAAVAVSCSVFGLNLEKVIVHLRNFRFSPMRMELKKVKNIKIINDCYNANPQSMKEALLTLKNIQTPGRRIAVLGDMLELGKKTLDFHYQLGKLCAIYQIDILVTVGNFARNISDGAKEVDIRKKNISTPLEIYSLPPRKAKSLTGIIFDNIQKTAEILSNILKPKDVILIKGSRKMEMEKIIDILAMAKT